MYELKHVCICACVCTCTCICLQVEMYENDPLIWHGPLKARWGIALMTSIELFRENVDQITLPLLLIHGSEDHLVPLSTSHFINDNASSQEKRFEVRQNYTSVIMIYSLLYDENMQVKNLQVNYERRDIGIVEKAGKQDWTLSK